MRFSQYVQRVREYLRPGRLARRAERPRRPLRMEPLEDRSVPATILAGGTLTILGTGGNDVIVLRNLGGTPYTGPAQVLVNGVSEFVGAWGSFNEVDIFAGAGNDSINIFHIQLGRFVKVDAGFGNDVIDFGAGLLDAVNGWVWAEGGPGLLGLRFNDQLNPAYANFVITAANVVGATWGFTYFNVRELELNTGTGGNNVLVASTAFGTVTRVNMGAGHDILDVGAGDLDAIRGNLFATGGSGRSDLHFNDHLQPGAVNYVVTDSYVARHGFFFWYTGVHDLVLNTGTGRNDVLVASTAAGTVTYVNMGLGNDILDVGAGDLDTLRGALWATGGPGRVALHFNDHLQPGAVNYVVTDDEVRRRGFVFHYRGVQELVLNTGSGNNDIFIQSTHAGTVTYINGGLGNDILDVGEGDLDTIRGHLYATGGSGRTDVHFNDQDQGGSVTYTLDRDRPRDRHTLTRPGVFFWYRDVDDLILNAGRGSNVINVRSTAHGTDTTVNAGRGGDTINVGSADHELDDILGHLAVRGQSGVDRLNVNDQGSTADHNVVITDHYVDSTGAARITYNSVARVTVNASQGDNRLGVRSTASGVVTVVNGGGGDDTFLVGNDARRLNGIDGDLTVDGQGGNDRLFLYDQGSAADYRYRLTEEMLTRTSMPGEITYDHMERLVLDASQGDNTILVDSTAADTETVINAEDGADRVVLGTLPAGRTTVNGGDGADSLTGPDVANLWELTGSDRGRLNADVTFAEVEDLIGGAGDDRFVFQPGGMVAGSLDGGGGINTLDYGYLTDNVTVILPNATATGVGDEVHNIRNVVGGAGNDVLVGDDLANQFDGGAGRDLLIGGGRGLTMAADTLNGGADDDILIAGFTDYDTDAAQLGAIRTLWTSGDDYATRVANLRSGTGAPRLDETTVFSSQAVGGCSLTGGDGLDLFYADAARDVLPDRDPVAETLVPVV